MPAIRRGQQGDGHAAKLAGRLRLLQHPRRTPSFASLMLGSNERRLSTGKGAQCFKSNC
jgi:hypothetical protein